MAVSNGKVVLSLLGLIYIKLFVTITKHVAVTEATKNSDCDCHILVIITIYFFIYSYKGSVRQKERVRELSFTVFTFIISDRNGNIIYLFKIESECVQIHIANGL